MPIYVIIGASRGLGYQYLKTLAKNPENTVVAVARTPSKLRAQLDTDAISNNVHVVDGDMTSPTSLIAAAESVSSLTDHVDYLIVNGAYINDDDTFFMKPSEWAGREALFETELNKSMRTNVTGVLFTINAFISLVEKSNTKKVAVISTGISSPEFVKTVELADAVPYSLSKAAVNLLVQKYAIEYKDKGVVFLSLSPGLVATSDISLAKISDERLEGFKEMSRRFLKYEPQFTGPISPEESVEKQLAVIHKAALSDSGAFVSHHGTQRWI